MNYILESMKTEHRLAVIDIFNYFVENSYAAYMENKVPYGFFNMFFDMSNGYPAKVAKNSHGDVVGFALLHAYHSAEAFKRTAELTYFILPEHTGKGIGRAFLDLFTEEAREKGIDHLLASISSLNEDSMRFHSKCGFEECGRFKNIGRKFGNEFDVIWMQKSI
ncbi:MAG: N-acetyltransferase [Deltaproteobacteria bacterium]|nr:N-acetyltransferase [Deltaproteobacteria bacterium]